MWELDYKESWAQKNWCFWTVVLEKTLDSPLDCKEIHPFWRRSVLGVLWKDWCWSWNSNILATSCKELTHWKRLWCWEGLGAGREGDDRGWDGWMASLTRWTWVWVNSGSWLWTGRSGVLRFVGSQRVGHSWASELNWTEPHILCCTVYVCLYFSYLGLKTIWWNRLCYPRWQVRKWGLVERPGLTSPWSFSSWHPSQDRKPTPLTNRFVISPWHHREVVTNSQLPRSTQGNKKGSPNQLAHFFSGYNWALQPLSTTLYASLPRNSNHIFCKVNNT